MLHFVRLDNPEISATFALAIAREIGEHIFGADVALRRDRFQDRVAPIADFELEALGDGQELVAVQGSGIWRFDVIVRGPSVVTVPDRYRAPGPGAQRKARGGKATRSMLTGALPAAGSAALEPENVQQRGSNIRPAPLW